MGWQLVSMHQADLVQLAAALPPLFSWMQRISTTMAEVSMCSIGNLMQHSIQVHACHETGIRMLKDIHSAIMAIFITGLGNLLEVRLSIWHFQCVHALWVFKFSLTGFPSGPCLSNFLAPSPFWFLCNHNAAWERNRNIALLITASWPVGFNQTLLPHQFCHPQLALPLLVPPLKILPS